MVSPILWDNFVMLPSIFLICICELILSEMFPKHCHQLVSCLVFSHKCLIITHNYMKMSCVWSQLVLRTTYIQHIFVRKLSLGKCSQKVSYVWFTYTFLIVPTKRSNFFLIMYCIINHMKNFYNFFLGQTKQNIFYK